MKAFWIYFIKGFVSCYDFCLFRRKDDDADEFVEYGIGVAQDISNAYKKVVEKYERS